MEDAKYIELAAKYLSGDINSAERRKLMEWVAAGDANQAFFDEMIHLWGLTGDAERSFEADTAGAWEKVTARIAENPVRKKGEEIQAVPPPGRIIPLSINRRILRIAAVLLPLLAVGAWWLLQPKHPAERLIATAEETEAVLLPDGSRIWLNKNSQLRYLEDFQERKVTLVGEAYFEIARDSLHPFEIYSDQTITRVLGTSFNIRAYPGEEKVELTVTTGKVAFEAIEDQKDQITLAAGQAAVFLKEGKKVQETSSLGTNAMAWKNKSIDARHIPLGDFLQILNNYFGRRITVADPEVLDCNTFLTDLEQPELNSVLYMVETMMGFTIDSTGEEIVLLGKGCKN